MRRARLLAALAILAGFVTLTADAQAGPLLKFDIPLSVTTATNNRVTYAGSGAPIIGTNINVDKLTGSETNANDLGSLTITNGDLDFATPGFTAVLPGPPVSISFMTGTGNFTLSGTAKDGATTIASGVLAQGTIKSATLENGQGGTKVAVALTLNTVNDDLQDYYATFGDQWTGTLTVSFRIATSSSFPPIAFTSTRIVGGSFDTSPIATPEPATIVSALVGMAGFGAVGWLRRRKQRNA